MSPVNQIPTALTDKETTSTSAKKKSKGSQQPPCSSTLKHSKYGSIRTETSRSNKEKHDSNVDELRGPTVGTRVVYFDKDPDGIHGVLKYLGSIKKFDDTVWAVVETVSYILNFNNISFRK